MAPHLTTFKVRFHELDLYGHANHTAYIRNFESARVEALEAIGFGIEDMQRSGCQIVLVELTSRFRASAVLHDTLRVTTAVVDVGRVSSRWHQEAHRDGELIAMLDLHAAFTDLQGRPRRAPEGFAESAEALRADAS